MIQDKWVQDTDISFYYVTDSNNPNVKLAAEPNSNKNVKELSYNWFSSPLHNEEKAVASAEIGIIIMLPALRKMNTDKDNDALIFSQLHESLLRVHSAGILHCDIRPSNCLKFDQGWQLVDFDLAVPITTTVDVVGLRPAGKCVLIEGSLQLKCAGYKVQEKFNEEINDKHDSTVEIDWTVDDDIEMLHLACKHMFD
jgi:serine/threonine protein kinase